MPHLAPEIVRNGILLALVLFALAYAVLWARRYPTSPAARPTPDALLTGFVTNFFDTLGIGSFATTTSIFKFRKTMVPDDRHIPGTLNAGHTLPVVLQAFIYISVIEVEWTTLVPMILGAVVGSWFGAGVVASLPKRKVQIGVGCALLVACLVLLMRQFDLFPAGGAALGLSGWKLPTAVLCNALFAAISTLGIGFYAPCMTLVGLLGMNPTAAFPIMMGSAALILPAAAVRFVRSGRYDKPTAIAMTVGGIPGVLVAAFIVKSLSLDAVRWLVVGVLLYTSVLMWLSARNEARAGGLNLATS